jgi:hypothetical protein
MICSVSNFASNCFAIIILGLRFSAADNKMCAHCYAVPYPYTDRLPCEFLIAWTPEVEAVSYHIKVVTQDQDQ